ASMMADSTIASRVDHLGMHIYGRASIPGSPYPPRTYWLTETADWCSTCDLAGAVPDEWWFARRTTDFLLNDVTNGFTGILVWDGYDSFYYHHNSRSYWGLLAYDQATGAYTPRKRFFANAQINRFIRSGAVRIATNTSISGLTVVAFASAANGSVTIV